MEEQHYKISESRLLELLEIESELIDLENSGVDNWSGYEEGEYQYGNETCEEFVAL